MKRFIRPLLIIATMVLATINIHCAEAHDFKVKGFHIDLRTEIMTMPALKAFATRLHEIGVNTILMEYEASFPYEKHFTISSKYAYTRDEIRDFVKHCTALGIDIIPLQQTFGHTDYILRHVRYSSLAESKTDPTQICPLKTAECIHLFDELLADMISLHTSRYFHIGGDETRLLGVCPKCAEKVAKEGTSKLFVDYMKEICNLVIRHGKIPVMWADIILAHPEYIKDLPKETIFVDWNYGWSNREFGDAESLAKQGVKFWGAPSIRSHPDNMHITMWEKHFNNQKVFIPYCREQQYNGIVMTSWSTSGIFSTIWELDHEVIDMIPLRYVYPMNGFNLLIYMYGKALNQVEPIDPESVVKEYAQQQLGLSADEGTALYSLLTIPQVRFPRAQPRADHRGERKSYEEIIEELNMTIATLSKMKPKRNKSDLEHLRLMFEIRLNYVKFKKLESDINHPDATIGSVAEYATRMGDIIATEKSLCKRFATLQKGYLHPSEIDEINRARTAKMFDLFNRLNAANRR